MAQTGTEVVAVNSAVVEPAGTRDAFADEFDDGEIDKDSIFLEKPFLIFCAILLLVTTVFSVFIFLAQRYMKTQPVASPEVEQCLSTAREMLANVCTAYTVVCKNSILAIDLG